MSSFLAFSSGRLELWDVATRKKLTTLAGGKTYNFVFSPDGRMVATGVFDKIVSIVDKKVLVHLWDITSAKNAFFI